MTSSHPVSSSDSSTNGNPRRKILAAAVGAILLETGFQSVEKAALGSLAEMLQSVIIEIGRSSRNFTEIAYRTEPVVADIQLAIAEMGINIDSIQSYAKRPTRIAISTPGQQMETKPNCILQVGDKKPHPSHIPDYLPPFPDTHTYCFSHTYKQPVTEYEAIREKSAQQKRDIERALTKFATKTNESLNLFMVEDKEFSLISVKPNYHAYLDALMPRDQVFMEDEEYEAKSRKKRKQRGEENGETADNKEKEKETPDEVINPYLRNVKMPKKTKKT
ncbi:UNVERIFIED_CONTAM: hypothetical protein RMT77_003636 [Armadillidium vulgare]|nr:Transcription initiation factor TFIID subunit 8 [Armadillidium vulgare]